MEPFLTRADHFQRPLPPLQADAWIDPMNRGFEAGFDRWCVPAGAPHFELRGGWLYGGTRPPKDGSVIAERLRHRRSLPEDARIEAADRWLTVELPRWRERREALDDTDVAAAADGLSALLEARFAEVIISTATSEWLLAATDRGATEAEAVAALRLTGREDLAVDGDLSMGTDVLAATTAELVSGSTADDGADGVDSGAYAELSTDSDPGSVEGIDPAAALLARLPDLAETLPDARRAQHWREATHHELCCWVGCLRRRALGRARQLGFADPTAALFLTATELTGGVLTPELEALAAERRRTHDRFAAAPPPPTIGTPPSPPRLPPDVDPALARLLRAVGYFVRQTAPTPGPPQIGAGRLDGVGAAPPDATGPVRVIADVDDLHQLVDGEIIVCAFTSPGWEPAMRIAAAVVSDSGGLLSHTAVLARELGIPAVVGTKVATGVLRTGQQVTVDGHAGVVRWHS
ncbi:MAG: PEP-utilizing enzyme [Microthrixaceae bacterium]